MDHWTDQELLSRCISGDSRAQEAFVKKFSDFIYRSVQHALRLRHVQYSQSELEDLHNSVFVKLLEKRCKKLGQYEGKNGCSLLSWIRLVTVRIVIDHLRKAHTDALTIEGRTLPMDAIADVQADTPEPLTLIEKEEQSRLIREGLRALLPRDRLFLKLHFLKEMPIRQVAEIMGLSENNAHSLKHRAVKRLKNKIAQNTKDIFT